MKSVSSGSKVMNSQRLKFGNVFCLVAICLLAQLVTTQGILLRSPPLRRQSTLQTDLARGAAQLSLADAIRSARPSQQVSDLLQHVRLASNGTGLSAGPEVSSEEMRAAVTSLNSMALKAQERFDGKSLDCIDFDEKSKRLFEQVQKDTSRIGIEQSATQARLTSARESLGGVEVQRQTLTERHAEEDKVLARQLAGTQERLSQARSDMEKSEYLLDVTKCGGTLFLSNVKGSTHLQSVTTGFKVCQGPSGSYEVEFEDARLQNFTKSFTPEGKWQLQLALGRSHLLSQGVLANLVAKEGGLDAREDGNELALLQADPTKQEQQDEQQANKCTFPTSPSCGEIHDIFANLWGDMKDTFDELGNELQSMKQSKKDFHASFQHELVALGTSQGMLEAGVVDITNLQAQLAGELADKAQETARIKEFASKMKLECTTVLDEIVRGEMCGIVKLRLELASLLNEATPEDCQVGDWQKSGACTKSCGGGTQTFKRKLIKQGSSMGTSCPALERVAKCNEMDCPLDCKLSSWAPWSDCTQVCGGGLRYRTRAREVAPKNGGFACGVMQETQQCGTEACDRNCRLGEWSTFSACSQACDAGFSFRQKPVLAPAVGAGKCAVENSIERLDRKECNKHKCIGDEMCTTKLDLVIAIDGSGSMTRQGFAVLQKFASKLVERMEGGQDKVRVGVVQFGNGALDANKVVSDAIAVLPLGTDVNQAASSVAGLSFQKGFTNLAQAAMKSRDLLRLASPRPDAQSVVIFLTDGRPTFKQMASYAMQQLKASARVMVVQVKKFPEKHNMDLLKGYATDPAEVNYLHIDGKVALEAAYDAFATKLIVQACQSVASPGDGSGSGYEDYGDYR